MLGEGWKDCQYDVLVADYEELELELGMASLLSVVVMDKRCSDYDEDCYLVPDPFCCWADCLDVFEGRADGYCPLIHSVGG